MRIGYIIFLGLMFLAAVAYAAMGGGTVLLFVWMMIVVVSVIWTIGTSEDVSGPPERFKRSLIGKLKPYHCQWCKAAFWTQRGARKHNFKAHPVSTKQQIAIAKQRLSEGGSGGSYMPNRDRKCTWCDGEGFKHGVRCDWCGGSGRLP